MQIQAAYQEALRYLYESLPMFSRMGKDAIKKDLTNIRRLCEALGNPHQIFQSIHVAGTNGKGSTSHMLAAVLNEAGYKTGLYTSPHLVDFRERIRISGMPVSREWVVDFVSRHKELVDTIQPSFFEITVAMAFQFFAEQQVDFAIIETGLGGRLDSTNIITPVLSIITNISFDHKDVLGSTLKEIAAEKAGIIKTGVPVLIGEQQEDIANVFFETAIRNHSTVYYAQALWDLVRIKESTGSQHFKAINKAKREMYDLTTDLPGTYQAHNLRTVLAATDVLQATAGLNLPLETTLSGLSAIKKLTGIRGRWDILQSSPLIVADVAHNPAGLREVLQQWGTIQAHRKHIVIGFVRDKDIQEALAFFPQDARYHFCNANVPRALPAEELHRIATGAGLTGKVCSSVSAAIEDARSETGKEDAILITGSFFTVGEAISFFETLSHEQERSLSVMN